MVKSSSKLVYVCRECGKESTKWFGRCPDCQAWNSFSQMNMNTTKAPTLRPTGPAAFPQELSEVEISTADRSPLPLAEFNRVLGGGLVAGSLTLVSGDPGIGKSTLLLQAFAGLSGRTGKLLYVSGEESPQQIKMRADRLSVNAENIILLPETSLEGILEAAGKMSPDAMVIDSIQTVYTEELMSAPGSVGQVRECAAKLMLHAKRSHIPVFIVGHVTKEGTIAGPRVLEHIVDTVLYFEGDRGIRTACCAP